MRQRHAVGSRIAEATRCTGVIVAEHISFDDFLAHRLKRPADVEPVTLEDMERAIARGAVGDDV